MVLACPVIGFMKEKYYLSMENKVENKLNKNVQERRAVTCGSMEEEEIVYTRRKMTKQNGENTKNESYRTKQPWEIEELCIVSRSIRVSELS